MLSKSLRQAAVAHIQALANEHKIHVRRRGTWEQSWADPLTRMVTIPEVIRTGTDYLTALHEMGHLVDRTAMQYDLSYCYAHGRRAGNAELAVREAACWAWAFRNAKSAVLKGFTKGDWLRIGTSWVSYLGPVW